jgi:hypothetical protein
MRTTARVPAAVPGSSGPWIANEMTIVITTRSLLPFGFAVGENRARPAEKRGY